MKPFVKIPTPKALPILGHVFEFSSATKKGKTHELMNQWYQQLGSIYRLKIVNQDVLVVSDPDMIETVMRKAMDNGGRTADVQIVDHIIAEHKLPASIATNDYEQWKRTRPLANVLLQPQLVNNLTPRISVIAQEWCEKVKEMGEQQPDKSYVLKELRSSLNFYTLESIVAITFGKKLGLTRPNFQADSNIRNYMIAVERVVDGVGRAANTFPLWKYFKTPFYKEMEKYYLYAYDYAKKIRHNLTSIPIEKIEDGITNLSSVYTALGEKNGLTAHEILAVDTGAAVLGVDTTSAVSSIILYELAINPTFQEEIFEEICQVMNVNGSTPLPPIQHSQLKKMTLLKNFVKDAIRKSPAVPINLRTLYDDIELNGYHVPKNTLILLFNYGVNRDEKHFVNATQVNPHRYTNENSKVNEYSMLLFGLGERACPGKRIAMAEIYMIAANVVYQFKLKSNAKDYDLIGGILLSPKITEENRIHFTPRF